MAKQFRDFADIFADFFASNLNQVDAQILKVNLSAFRKLVV